MRVSFLLRRLLAIGEGSSDDEIGARGQMIDDLLREGYQPEEIRAALDCLEATDPACSVGGEEASFRFLANEERAILTPKAHAAFVRLQKRGFLDPYQAEAIASWIRRAAPARVGVRTLNGIIEYVCEQGGELVRLDGSGGNRHLN